MMNKTKGFFANILLILSLSLVSCSNSRDKTFKKIYRPSFIEKSGITYLFYSGISWTKGYKTYEHFVEFDGFALDENNMSSNLWEKQYHVSDKVLDLNITREDYFDEFQIGKNVCYYITSNEELKKFNLSYFSSVNLSLSKKNKQFENLDMGYFHFRLPFLDFSNATSISGLTVPQEIIINYYIDGEKMCKLIDIFPNSFYTPYFVVYGYSNDEIYNDSKYNYLVEYISAVSSSLTKITFNIYCKYQCLSITNRFRLESWIDDHYIIQFVKGINMDTLKWSFYKKDPSSIQYDPGIWDY